MPYPHHLTDVFRCPTPRQATSTNWALGPKWILYDKANFRPNLAPPPNLLKSNNKIPWHNPCFRPDQVRLSRSWPPPWRPSGDLTCPPHNPSSGSRSSKETHRPRPSVCDFETMISTKSSNNTENFVRPVEATIRVRE